MKRATLAPLYDWETHKNAMHTDILGPIYYRSLGGNVFAAPMIKSISSYLEVFSINSNSKLADLVIKYFVRTERDLFRKERRDNFWERTMPRRTYQTTYVQCAIVLCIWYCNQDIATIYAAEQMSIRTTGRRYCFGAIVMMFAAELFENMWREALYHEMWLRNRFPWSSFNSETPYLFWNRNETINYALVHKFGTQGHVSIYQPSSLTNKSRKRSNYVRFVGMKSDEQIVRGYILFAKFVPKVRFADFHTIMNSNLT